MYPLIAVLMLIVLGFSLYGGYQINFGPDTAPYKCVTGDEGALPRDDMRGAFIQLKPGADSRCPTNLWELLELTDAGMVPAERMLQVPAAAIDAVLINQVSLDPDTSTYTITATGQPPVPTVAQRLRNDRLLRLQAKAGTWDTGAYEINAPSGGMFDNSRFYYAFAVK